MTAWPPPSGLPHFRSLFDGWWRATLNPGVVCARCGAKDWTHHQCGTACLRLPHLPTSCGEFLPPGPRPKAGA